MSIFIILIYFLLNPIWAGTKIVGGKNIDASNKLSRSTVALITEYKKELKVSCTGSLIAPKVIITAAHCIHHIISDRVFVSNGVNPLANKEKVKVTHLLYFSPQFWSSTNSGDDIAILIMENTFSKYEVAKLGNPSLLKIGTSVTQLGYGFQKFSPSQDDFQYPTFGKLQILEDVSKISSIQKQLLETSFPNGYGIAGGDSGGPLIITEGSTPYLFGVTSTGGQSQNEDGTTTNSAGYTIPYYFIDWINSALPAEFRVNVPFEVKDQFKKSEIKAVLTKDFPAFNRRNCNKYRLGWDIDEDQVCWPCTKESCQQFERDDVPGEVQWNENELKCEVI